MNDKSVLKMVEERWEIADRAREEYAQRAIENERLYQNYIDETTHPYLSNIALPWPYTIIESYLGKCIQMLAAVLPYVHVVEEDDDSRRKAKKVEKDVNMVFYIQKWPVLSYKIYKQAFKYGTAFVFEEPWGMVNEKEMPVFHLCNFFKIWVNPFILDLDDDDAFLIHETFVPIKSLKKLKGNPNYKNLNSIEVWDGEIFEPEEQEIRAFKGLPSTGIDPHAGLVHLRTYWSKDELYMITNKNNVIRNQKNFLGKIPYKKITPIPIEDEFYGMSILEQGKYLFAEANENRNQYNDAVNLMLNPQWIIERGADVKRSNIITRAGNIIFTESVDGIRPLPIDWNILPQAIARGRVIENDIMNYSNAFPQFRGAPTSGQETATEYLGIRSAGELRSDTYNLLLAMTSIEDMTKDIVDFKRIFMTEPITFYYWPEELNSTVTPEDYNGNFSYKAYAAYKHAREIERKQLIEAMTFIFGAGGAFLPLVLPRAQEWLERLLDYFPAIRSPEQLFVSQEELMMQQMANLLPTILSGGAAGRPALGEKEMRLGPEETPNPPTATMLSNQIIPR